MATSSNDLLDQVNTAITRLLAGSKSWSVDGATYTKEGLDALRKMRSDLKAEVSRTSGKRPFRKSVGLGSMGYS